MLQWDKQNLFIFILIINKFMALVYRHLKPCGEVFYIGIGVSKKRAYSKHGRNKHWINTVNKYGYEIQILTNNIDYEFAKEIEVNLISYYGRKDLNFGKLVNMTDGGDGATLAPVIVGRTEIGTSGEYELDLGKINEIADVQFIRETSQTTRRAGRGI